MKKILSVLTVCLATLLPLNSQALLSDSCTVPCESLRKAILVYREKENVKKQLTFSRDSISVLKQVILAKDSIIFTKDTIIDTYHKNENRYEQTISLKDTIINRRNNEIANLKKDVKKFKTVSIVSLVLFFLTIIF